MLQRTLDMISFRPLSPYGTIEELSLESKYPPTLPEYCTGTFQNSSGSTEAQITHPCRSGTTTSTATVGRESQKQENAETGGVARKVKRGPRRPRKQPPINDTTSTQKSVGNGRVSRKSRSRKPYLRKDMVTSEKTTAHPQHLQTTSTLLGDEELQQSLYGLMNDVPSDWQQYLTLTPDQMHDPEVQEARLENYTSDVQQLIGNRDLYVWQLLEEM